LGVAEIAGKQAFVLEFLQAREPDMVRRPFFAKYDPKATWYDELEPLSASDRPFFIGEAGPWEDWSAPGGQGEAVRDETARWESN
jgi:hypothetical protein